MAIPEFLVGASLTCASILRENAAGMPHPGPFEFPNLQKQGSRRLMASDAGN
ncbi:MAG TPA: hypothetical protein VLK85_32755 [Ramlibacter sp.]|nr:hypothetical protein [Ramlibacter sp.]